MDCVEKIRKGQMACGSGSCDDCPYSNSDHGQRDCCEELTEDTLACLARLMEEKDELIKKIESLLVEREMMKKALQREAIACDTCKHSRGRNKAACEEADFYCGACDLSDVCPCAECTNENDKWEWCGNWGEDEDHD